MSPATFLLAVAQAALLLVAGWVIGQRFLAHVGAGSLGGSVGAPERMLFALVGGVAFSVALMVGNIVTGGAVFGTAVIVPLAWVVVVVGGRATFTRPRGMP